MTGIAITVGALIVALVVFYLGIKVGKSKERAPYLKLRQEFNKLTQKHSRCNMQLHKADQLISVFPIHESDWQGKNLKQIRGELYKAFFYSSDIEMSEDQILECMKSMSRECLVFCHDQLLPENKRLILQREYNKILEATKQG